MTSDRWLVRLVGVTVCLSALCLVVVIALLAAAGGTIPDVLDRLGFLLLGGLLGALTTRLTGDDPVAVQTPPGQPLEVSDAGS